MTSRLYQDETEEDFLWYKESRVPRKQRRPNDYDMDRYRTAREMERSTARQIREAERQAAVETEALEN